MKYLVRAEYFCEEAINSEQRKWFAIIDNSLVCMTYFWNYPIRKFWTKCHISPRIIYNSENEQKLGVINDKPFASLLKLYRKNLIAGLI